MKEERTKSYIKLVLAPQMGQGIMLNTVRESAGISFLKSSGDPGYGCEADKQFLDVSQLAGQ